MKPPRLTRRRTLTIIAAACLGAGGAIPLAEARREWRGAALGAEGRLIFHGLDRATADRAVAQTLAEIDRLENVFSLYRPNSEISRLNRHASLPDPSHDLKVVLAAALDVWRRSDGAFNPAIQPLWRLLTDHFAGRSDGRLGEPDPDALAHTLTLCGPAEIVLRESAITMKPGMAITLNGIAQGYITDMVASLLRSQGLANILVQLGETRALPGRPWRMAIEGSDRQIRLENDAVATSAGSGTKLSPDGRWHHLLDPKTGRSARDFSSVTVRAPSAMMADALSTALTVAGRGRLARLAQRFPRTSVFAVASSGEPIEFPAGYPQVFEPAAQLFEPMDGAKM